MAAPTPNTPRFPTGGAAVTASDTAVFMESAVYVGNGGNVAVRPADGSAVVTFVGIPNGSIIPMMIIGIMSTNTTATAFVRLT